MEDFADFMLTHYYFIYQLLHYRVEANSWFVIQCVSLPKVTIATTGTGKKAKEDTYLRVMNKLLLGRWLIR